jgi:hypothetical protein
MVNGHNQLIIKSNLAMDIGSNFQDLFGMGVYFISNWNKKIICEGLPIFFQEIDMASFDFMSNWLWLISWVTDTLFST